MILQRVTIVMHSMTKKSNSWTRNFKSNTLALAILVILLSNAVTMTEQRSISSIYKTSSSSQEKDTTSKVETVHKIIRQGGPSWLIPKVASHKFTARRSRSGLLSALRPRRTSRQQTGLILVNSQTPLTPSSYLSLYKTLSHRLQKRRYITFNRDPYTDSNSYGKLTANFTTVGHPSQLID